MNKIKKNALLIGSLLAFNSLWADNIITDFEEIARIELSLKPNQTLMIDHRKGALLGIMEISPSGKIKTLPIPQELRGKSESDVMGKSSPYKTDVEHFGNTSTTIYTRQDNALDSEQKGVEDLSKGVQKRQGNHQWDKSKIIFEQESEVLDIMR